MIIQSAPPGARRFAITMDDHTALAGRFACAFGNERFAPVEPREVMMYVIAHHDKGWLALDGAPHTDPRSGLPYNLLDTPIEEIIKTSAASADFNERHHPYCGLLSSMHSWGLYNGRYGMSSKVLIDGIPPQHKEPAMRMLEGELRRQERLKGQLAADPATAAWIEKGHLFQNYKQLQFFDTLALYFNRTHAAARREERFDHVPIDAVDDTAVTITPLAADRYALSPYPFAASPATFEFRGRYLEAAQSGADTDWISLFAHTAPQWQTMTLIAA
jgi:hypothetical protein